LQKLLNPEVAEHVNAVKFFTKTLRNYTLKDLSNKFNNMHLHKGPHVEECPFEAEASDPDDHQTPSFVSDYLETLDNAKRPVSQVRKNARSG